MGWASRPSFKDGRDAHPTRKKRNYLIDDPYDRIIQELAVTELETWQEYTLHGKPLY
ncbi:MULTISPECIES: hypothetical protein [unclassified Microcoleus]|uniref:hypothetical protein n=1 Tax=unclassified Microcoleus TaxID=2642155 RepID=UPI002FD3200B